MTDQYVAQTILDQLGGGRFRLMTGAKLGFDETSLTAKFPRGFARVDSVKIELMPDDTYNVTFFGRFGRVIRPLITHEQVYCDSLASLVSRETGLALSLGGRS